MPILLVGLSAIWVAWRDQFTGGGAALAVVAFFGGMMFLAPYLLWAIVQARGDAKVVLLGNTLAAIFVSPDCQGRGIGAALIDDAKTRRERMRLTVFSENGPSVRFYEKHGFVTLGEQIDENTGHSELIMEYRS